MKRLLLVAVAALLVPASASGDVRSETFEVTGQDDCGASPDSEYQVSLPARAISIEPTPNEDALLPNPSGEPLRVWAVNGLRDGSEAVTWTVETSTCQDAYNVFTWSAGLHTFTANFETLSKSPRLGGPKAKRAASKLLRRKFYWDVLNGRKLRCAKRVSSSSRMCSFFGFAGDGSYRGKIRVSLFSKQNTSLYARLRFRAQLKDYYCHAVRELPWSQCTKQYRGRTRVGL